RRERRGPNCTRGPSASSASLRPLRSLSVRESEVLVLLSLGSEYFEPVRFVSEPLLLGVVGGELLRLLHRIARRREFAQGLEVARERLVSLGAPGQEDDEPPRLALAERRLVLLLRVRGEPFVEEGRI